MSGAIQTRVSPRRSRGGLILPPELRGTLQEIFSSCPVTPGTPLGGGGWSKTLLGAFVGKNERFLEWAGAQEKLPKALMCLGPDVPAPQFAPIFEVLHEEHGTIFLASQLSPYRRKKVEGRLRRALKENEFVGPFDMPRINGKSLPLLTALIAVVHHSDLLDAKAPEYKPERPGWNSKRLSLPSIGRDWNFGLYS